ncbi:uncharacterized protein YcfL [Deinobacterium chartae]|uniref:Uncharacterized protein YcfL n=1 Tax=Deinobacterium chartae TaxID=521158 RepID=A0A841HZ85_9DEIO|nr:hypothetical protein [Deinobacterium chartae]MBB6097520.1 uncharacterized protein YcfL [Deinobacterium chartae]
MRKLWLIIPLALLVLTACRAETQNKLRRQVLDLANTRQYITVYSYDGKELFSGMVDGKVTRAGNEDGGQGTYVYWFDERGRYHQTNMPYLATTYDRNTPQR